MSQGLFDFPAAPAARLPLVASDAADSLAHGRTRDAAAIVPPNGAFATLTQWGVIDAIGADAASFLHNQLTNDVAQLPPHRAALGGLCSPKGRLLATFLYWRLFTQNADETSSTSVDVANGIRLLVSADIREAIQKRLSMFILRSKVKLHDATPSVSVIGLTAHRHHAQRLQAWLGKHFSAPTQALEDVLLARCEAQALAYDIAYDNATLVRLSDAADHVRYLLVVDATDVAKRDAWMQALQAEFAPLDAQSWSWLDVQSAEPRITAPTQERFVPQMINYEAIGGVNFRKGCYPGQEIVARSQYRGTIKRRATLAHAITAMPGDEVFDEREPQQPCGHIVNVAPAPGGGVDCLVELKLAMAVDATLHVGSLEGPALHVLGLPYRLPSLSD